MPEVALKRLAFFEAAECELAYAATDHAERAFHFHLAEQYVSLIVMLRAVDLNRTTHICMIPAAPTISHLP